MASGIGGLAEDERHMRQVLATELHGILECQGDATLVLHDKVAKCIQVVGSLAWGESHKDGSGMKDKGKGKEKERDDDETLS